MMTFKKLFIYSIAIIGMFSLTAISCEGVEDMLDVKAPITIKKSFELKINEAQDSTIVQTIDPSEGDLETYRDRIKGVEAESLTLNVSDLGSNGNTGSVKIVILGEGTTPVFSYEISDLSAVGEEIEMELDSDAKAYLNGVLERFESFDITAEVSTDGKIHYQVDIAIVGVVKASAVSN